MKKKDHEIFNVIRSNDLESFREMCKDVAAIEVKDRYGRTPLLAAASNKNLEMVRLLLTLGADPNAADKNSWTALHFAAREHETEIGASLLKSGAAVDARDDNGNTPLSNVVFSSRGRGDFIQLLRSHGADPHLENKHGVSPLSLANDIANFDVAQWFKDLE